MSDSKLTCPKCQSTNYTKNGSTPDKKQKYMCKECGRQFIVGVAARRVNPTKKFISDETKELIDRLLLEKISLAGIARVTKVSEKWLQDYVNQKYRETSREINVSSKKKGKLTIEVDEMWSFVGSANKEWIWLAIDTVTREIVGVYIGKRDENGAQQLWNSLPSVYRQCAVCYTDFWAAYAHSIPTKRHKPVGKETGLTNHIERFNNTMRQRISRLVRKTLSFSKKLENHIGAIWYFIHYYNTLRIS